MGEFKYHEFLGMNSLMAALMSVICLFLGHTLRHYKVTWISESGAVMLFGLLIGGILSNFQKDELSFVLFKPELFFLPDASTHGIRGRILPKAEYVF